MFSLIIKQIVNRGKSNFWLGFELLLVFCLVWYIVDYLFVLSYNYRIPSHLNVENVYRIDIQTLPEAHPEYSVIENDSMNLMENFYRVVNRIKQHPEIEAFAVSFNQSYPGAGSYNGRQYRYPQDSSKFVQTQSFLIAPLGDYFQVFRHMGKDGRNVFSMEDHEWNDPNEIIISKMVEDLFFPEESALGKIILPVKGIEGEEYKVKGVIGDIKRFDSHRPAPVSFSVKRIDAENVRNTEISVRFKRKLNSVELTSFKQEMFRELRIGNYFLKNIVSYRKIVDDFNLAEGTIIMSRTHISLMFFFLLNILLCVMGTFWYRVNSRRAEIGVRRAMGATKEKVRHMFVAEGLIILTVIMIPAVLIEAQFVYAGLIHTVGYTDITAGFYLPDYQMLRFVLTNLITWFLIAFVILLSIWYPAYLAGRITPVEALRDE